jgi:WD40 repeat protein
LWRDLAGTKPQRLVEDLGPIDNVTIAPGRDLLAASGTKGVEVWDMATGKRVRKRFEELRTGRAQFFPDGKTLLVAGEWQQVWLWSIDTDKVRRYRDGQVVLPRERFETAVLSPDGKTLVETNREGGGTVRDPGTGEKRSFVTITDKSFGIDLMQFAPDSKTLAVRLMGTAQIHFVDVPTSVVLRITPKLGKRALTALAFSAGGHMLAIGCDDGSIRLVESASAQVRLHFGGHLGKINSLAFSPDGRLLATAGEDGTILLWDLGRLPDQESKPAPLSDKQRQALWTDLGSKDGRTAYRAIVLLSQDPAGSPAFLQQQLRTLSKHDAKQVRQWIDDLDNRSYPIRKKAFAELARLEDVAGPALHEALSRKPTVEVHRRLKLLLQKLNPPNPTQRQLHILRALEVLERAGNPEARKGLAEMARGAPESRLTRETLLALARLQKRSD